MSPREPDGPGGATSGAAGDGAEAGPTVVCLTPVRNESWILDRFLSCASLWADHIVVADQGSDDGSREIAAAFPKARVIENDSATFNEPERQKLLLRAAREIPGPRLLIALDADEFLTANFLESAEWATVLRAAPGTVIRFWWPSVLEGAGSYYTYPVPLPLGFVDDGSEHEGRRIHSPRVPTPPDAPEILLHDVRVMHYVGVDPERWRSRLRWYQCWEHLNHDRRRPAALYRFYNKDLCIPEDRIHEVPPEWLRGYEERGVDMTSVRREPTYRWDREVLKLIAEHGPERFRKVGIWDVNWTAIRRRVEEEAGDPPPAPEGRIRDPRSRIDRLVHEWLRRTQHHYSHYAPRRTLLWRLYLRTADRVLRRLGW